MNNLSTIFPQAAYPGSAKGTPTCEHPANRGPSQAHAQPHTDYSMAENHLPQCKRQALGRWKFRCVGGVLDHMKGLQVLPERVRWVGKPAMGESARGEKIAELPMNARLGNASENCQEGAGGKR